MRIFIRLFSLFFLVSVELSALPTSQLQTQAGVFDQRFSCDDLLSELVTTGHLTGTEIALLHQLEEAKSTPQKLDPVTRTLIVKIERLIDEGVLPATIGFDPDLAKESLSEYVNLLADYWRWEQEQEEDTPKAASPVIKSKTADTSSSNFLPPQIVSPFAVRRPGKTEASSRSVEGSESAKKSGQETRRDGVLRTLFSLLAGARPLKSVGRLGMYLVLGSAAGLAEMQHVNPIVRRLEIYMAYHPSARAVAEKFENSKLGTVLNNAGTQIEEKFP